MGTDCISQAALCFFMYVITVATAQLIPESFIRGAIKCFRCDSEKPNCDDPFSNRFSQKSLDYHLILCSLDQQCIKVITKDADGQKLVIRDCVSTQAYDTCNAMNRTYQDLTFCETCDSDACNYSSRVKLATITLLASILLLHSL